MNGGDQIALVLACGILAASAMSDLHRLRIPNAHVILMILLFLAAAPLLLSMQELQARLAVAAIAFGIGFSLFSFGFLGGGDVKLMAATLLFVPSAEVPAFLLIFSAALLASSLTMLVLQRSRLAALQAWESFRTVGHVPMAVSIFLAAAGVLGISGFAA